MSPTADDVAMLHTNAPLFANFAAFDGPALSRLYVRIDDFMNEILYIGLSAEADNNGNINSSFIFRIKDPDGIVVFGPHTVTTANQNTPTWALAHAGPDVLDPGNGYSTAPAYSTFIPAAVGKNGDYIIEVSDTPIPSVTNIKWFDFTVVKNGNQEQRGRLWSNLWAIRTPQVVGTSPPYCEWDRPFNGLFYSYTDDGFVSRVDFTNSGFQGLTFTVAFGATGPGNTGIIIEDRKSTNVGDSTANAADYMVFLSEPDEDIFPSPQSICGDVEILNIYCVGDSICIEVGITRPGLIEVLLDFFGNNGEFDPETTDVLLAIQLEEADTVCIYWDKLKGDGSMLAFNDPVPAIVRYSQGVQHYAAFDVEFLLHGYCVETIRPLCGGGQSDLLYWDDSNLMDDPATLFLDESDPGTGQPLVQLNGCVCQINNCRTWDNFQLGANPETCSGAPAGYGENRTLNTWWFAATTTLDQFELPVVRAQITGNANVCPGETTEFFVNTNPDTLDYTYTWSGPGGFSANTQSTGPVSMAGTYYVTIYDQDTDCQAVDSIEFVVSPEIMTSIEVECVEDHSPNANVILTVTGGTPPLTYEWSNGAMTQDLMDVPPGMYFVTVTDDNECSAVDSVLVEPCCDLEIVCPPVDGGTFTCVDLLPPADTAVVMILDYCIAVMVTVNEFDNQGSGCAQNPLIVTRNYIVTDELGNSQVCVQNFTVIDDIAPQITCPPNTTISCDASTDPQFTGMATATDNCDDAPSVTYSDMVMSGACPQEMTIQRTWTATDVCGNASSCIQMIAVVDDEAPMMICPSDVTIEIGDSTDPEDTGFASAEDNCDSAPVVNFSDAVIPGPCPGVMTIERTWTATDACGNVSSCVQIIQTTDDEPPMITCPPDVTIQCDESTDPSNTGEATAVDVGDEDPEVSFEDMIIPGECEQGMTIQRTWIATDACGNSTSCVQIIVVVDDTPPMVVCPPDVTIDCDASTDPSNTGIPTATDNCDPDPLVTYFDVVNQGICPHAFTISRFWLVTDDCGNLNSSCIQTITANDSTPPILSCPPNITIECDESVEPENTGMASAIDNCDDDPEVTYSDSVMPGECPQEYTIMRTWSATDACGNSTSCVQIIQIEDSTPPMIVPGTCPPDITISCDDEIEDFGEPEFTDNCGQATLEVMEEIIGFMPPSSEGMIIRTFIITDECGNVNSSCVQVITVVDDAPPTITCPADVTLECGSDTDPEFTGVATAFDNCAEMMGIEVTFSDMTMGFGACGAGTIFRTWTATDAAGNTAQCTQTITVEDNDPPTFMLPPDITVDCHEDLDDLSVTGDISNVMDCSEIGEISYSDMFGMIGCDGTGQIFRTWVVFDACGNSASDVQMIYVQDTIPPGLIPPPDVTITCEDNPQDTSLTGSVVVITDECSMMFMLFYEDDDSGLTGCSGTGQIIRTWFAGDECENFTMMQQVITVIDNIPPVAICQNITLNFDENPVMSITPEMVDGGSFDNCGEVTLSLPVSTFDCIIFRDDPVRFFNLIVTDECGNTSNCVFSITGEGGGGIIMSCPQDIFHNLPSGACEAILNYDVQAVRRCGTEDPVLVQIDDSGFTSGDAFPIGVTHQEYVAYNSLGDTVYCSFNIHVFENVQTINTLACNSHINISMDDDCEAKINPDVILEGGSFGCFDDFFVEVSNGVSGFNTVILDASNIVLGETYSVTITDTKTGFKCWGYVTIEDKKPPIVECFDVFILCTTPLQPVFTEPGLELLPYAPIAFDNCTEDLNYVFEDTFFESICGLDSIHRHWRISDEFGNVTECLQRIFIISAELEEIVFPPLYEGTCHGNAHPDITGYPTFEGVPIAIDPLCNVWAWYDDLTLDDCGAGTKIVRKWTVFNACTQEFVKGDQLLKLSDNEPPVLTCPDDQTVAADPWFCHASVNLVLPSAIDICGSDFTLTPSVSAGTLRHFGGDNWRIDDLPLGVHMVTWLAVDACDNDTTCTYTITVTDQTPPVPVCDAHTVLTLTIDDPLGKGLTKLMAESLDDGSWDNCGPVTFEARRMSSCIDFDWIGPAGEYPNSDGIVTALDRGLTFQPWVPFACCDAGNTIMVELRVTDAAGNINSCMVEVEVQDKLPPFVECPPDITVSCDYWFDAHATIGFQPADGLENIFGRVLDAYEYNDSDRRNIIINDPGNPTLQQPFNWGRDGWANDNCDVTIDVRLEIFDDCSGDNLPGLPPDNAVRLLRRTFRAQDAQGNVSTCIQRIWVVDFNPFYITDVNCLNANPNDGVIWPCDIELHTCPSGSFTPDDLNSRPTVFDDNCSIVGVTYSDQRFDFVDEACFKILRTWYIIDWCQYNQFTGAGYWEYVQVIKVLDTEKPVFLNCPAGPLTFCVDDANVTLPSNNQVFYGEGNPMASSCSAHIWLQHTVLETCSDHVFYDVKVYPFNGSEFLQLVNRTRIDIDGDTAVLHFDTRTSTIQQVRQNGLPYNSRYCDSDAYHRILWSVEDGCGNLRTCEYLFRLEDCKKPTPVCFAGLSTVVMPASGDVTIWAVDYDASSFDDCTRATDLLFSFDGNTYQPGLTITCDDIITNNSPAFVIQVWVADEGNDKNCNGQIEWSERNKDYCTVFLIVLDNEGVCGGSAGITGSVLTEDHITVKDVEVALESSGGMSASYTTAFEGFYHFFSLPGLQDYVVTPARNDDHRNGVSTLDMIVMQRHLLGLEPITSPYKLIAADVNNSQSVSIADMIDMRRLILGQVDEFPGNTSWRFVPVDYDFMDPFKPWPFDESIVLQQLGSMAMHADFVGVKIGDVNNTVQAHATQVDVRSGRPETALEMPDIPFDAGTVIRVPVSMQVSGLTGIQFTLETGALKFKGYEAGVLGLRDENLAVFDGMLTMSWHDALPVHMTSDDVLFWLVFDALSTGMVRENLMISSAITESEAYLPAGHHAEIISNLRLEFRPYIPVVEAETEFALYQNQPNPWSESTTIGFTLPDAMVATLTIYDASGAVVLTKKKEAAKGYSEFLITGDELPGAAVLYYRLDTHIPETQQQGSQGREMRSSFSATKKMLQIR